MSPWLVSTLIGVNVICACALTWASISVLNHMRFFDHWCTALSYILLGLGGFSALLTPPFLERVPTVTEVVMLLGVTLLVYGDRRRRTRLFKMVTS